MLRRFICSCFVVTGALGGVAMAAELPWRSPAPAQRSGFTVADDLRQLAERPDARRVVLQFDRPMTPGLRAQLAGAGVHLLSYLSNNAFFATLDTGVDALTATTGGALRSAAAINPEWKLHPVLSAKETPTWAVVSGDADPVIGVYVMLHPDADLAGDGLSLIDAVGGVTRDVAVTVNALIVEVPMSSIDALASADAIQWIEPAMPRMSELNNENRALTGANTVQASPYSLDGSGVTVLIYDGGTARSTHVDFGGRLTAHDSSGQATHATHVAATVGGNGSASSGTERGMAPGVTLLSYGFQYDGSGTFLYTNPGDIEADYGAAIGMGAAISNNSIGTNVEPNGFACSIQGDYGVTDTVIDAIVRGSLSGGAPFRIVWAAGNERQGSRCDVEGYGDYYSTAPPATAKNHLCIGAVNANDDSMTTFSSWGPTDDGRLKPDFVAPGCESGGDGGVTSASASSNTSYSSLCGTSMASPTACGLAALLLQDYRAQFGGPDPRNSTLKTLFAHNAVDLGNPGPDYIYGYGSIRIQQTIDFMRTGAFSENEASQGEVVQYVVNVAPGTPQLKITLAWDDPPGTPNIVPSLINDLDLRVYDPAANRRYPWTLNPSNPSANAVQTQEDHLNNIEQVLVNSPTAGVWIVEVVGTNVPEGPQAFSITGSPELVESGVRIRLPDGVPTLIAPGDAVSFPVQISSGTEAILPGTAALNFRYDGGAFQSIPLVSLGGEDYQANLPTPVCGATPEFYISVEGAESGVVTNPSAGAAAAYAAEVGADVIPYDDTIETDLGWTVGAPGDNATAGIWVRVDPVGTAAQPEDDHTADGVFCWVTGQGSPGGGLGDADVDNGRTTLTSPTIDAGGLDDPYISYWRWYSNDTGAAPNADVFTINISNNNGSTWTALEVVGPSGPGTSGGWNYAEFRVADFVAPTSQLRLRFIAADEAAGSLVEAAVDDVQLRGRICSATLDDCNGNGIADEDDIALGLSADANSNGVPDECDPKIECPGDLDGDNDVDLEDMSVLLSNFGVGGGAGPEDGDLDGDGDVDLADLSILLGAFGSSCS